MANPLAITLHPLGVEGGAWATSALDLLDAATGIQRQAARLTLAVTAIGADGLKVAVETSPDVASGWRVVDEFDLVTTPGTHHLSVHGLDRYLRASSPDEATFALAGTAHQLFLREADIYAAVRREAFEDVPRSEIAEVLIASSTSILNYLNSAYTAPIVQVDEQVGREGGKMAARDLLNARGRQPEGPDMVIDQAAAEAISWFRAVSQGRIRPVGIIDSLPERYEGGAVVRSARSRRGW